MSLKVLVVGGGLAGLATSIALGRQGHQIELGAALNITPNASRVFRKLGLDLQQILPSKCHHVAAFDKNGKYMQTLFDAVELCKEMQLEDDLLLVHRADLHEFLLKRVKEGFEGRIPVVHTGAKASSVDAENGVVYLDDGSAHEGDLIIGADGVHSKTVEEIEGRVVEKISTHQACFRFTIPTDLAKADVDVNQMLEEIGIINATFFVGDDRRIIVYPCRGGNLLNVAGILPENEIPESAWASGATVTELLDSFREFGSVQKKFLSMAQDLKLWKFETRDPPKTFVKGRLALVGDAAHPTLPHFGQGGAQGFEDAAALGALFTKETKPGEVKDHLKTYDAVRYNHAVTTMIMSRVPDEKRLTQMEKLREYVPKAEFIDNMYKYLWPSDPILEVNKRRDMVLTPVM